MDGLTKQLGRALWVMLASIAFFFSGSPAAAQIKHPVTVSARFEPSEVQQGTTVTLIVTAQWSSDYHIYAIHQTDKGPGPVPTKIDLAKDFQSQVLSAAPWTEPEAKTKWEEGFGRNVQSHYKSPAEFRGTFVVAPDARLGALNVEGTFRVQACTAESCLPPKSIKFTAPLTVTKGDGQALLLPTQEQGAGDAFAEALTANTPLAAGGSIAAVVQDDTPPESLLRFAFLAFLFGLAALLTPCVFPMIPITVSFFTKKASTTTGAAVKNAAIYVLSIIGAFALIGFGVSVVLRLMGAGVESSGFATWLAANPWVNLAFAALYIFFALSMFEVVHLEIPASISARFNKRSMTGTDAIGIASKAVVFVLISFTCTAPLLGVLIVQTLNGEWIRPFVGMTAFAAGLSLPFFFLALAPQLLSSLPKAGGWLYATKVVMGLLVLAAAFKFLSNADLVWNTSDMLLTREVLLAIWVALFAAIALYLLGLVRLPMDDEKPSISVGRLLLGTSFLALTMYLSAGLFGRDLHVWVESYLPPDVGPSAVASSSGGEEKMRWIENDLDSAFMQARAEGKPVFIDFTGWTCVNCRLMEKQMFPRPEVADRLSRFVRVKLYTDDETVRGDSTIGEINQTYQAKTFGTISLPFYAIMTPEGKVLATAAYETDPEKYVTFLDKGLRRELAAVR